MKTIFNKFNFLSAITALAFIMSSCGDDEQTTPLPTTSFSFEVDAENPLMVAFTNTSEDGVTYAWDFGDNSGTSTDENPTYTYSGGGTYTVMLTVTNDAGSDESTQDVTVTAPIVELISGGDMEDEEAWTVLDFSGNGNAAVTFTDGQAVWDETTDISSGDWDNVGHAGIYQTIEVEAGQEYQADMFIETNGIDEIWFEVWVGDVEPVAGDDYNADDGATRILNFNSWDCPDTNVTYSGQMAEASCADNATGAITFDAAGTYYVVIRSGGFNFGDGGIKIDDVTMKSTQ